MKAIITAAAFAIAATSAMAEPKCGNASEIKNILAGKYSERPVGDGIVDIDGEDALAVICTNPETSSFTITMTAPTGLTCIVFYGQNWQTNATLGKPEGEKS